MSEIAHKHGIKERPRWMIELIAAWGFAQRNYFLTKRYLLWEVVWLAYATVSAMRTTSSDGIRSGSISG